MPVQIEHDLDLPALEDSRQAEEYAASLMQVFRSESFLLLVVPLPISRVVHWSNHNNL